MLGFKIHDENEAASLLPKKSGKRLGKSINNVHFSEPFASKEDSISKISGNKIKVVKSGRKALSSLSGSQVNTRLAAGSTSTAKKTHDFSKDPSSFSILETSSSSSSSFTNIMVAKDFASPHSKGGDQSSNFTSSSSLPSTINDVCEPASDSNEKFSIPTVSSLSINNYWPNSANDTIELRLPG